MLTVTAELSSRPTPSKITRPAAISPATLFSTVTRARLTSWTTARILRLQDFLQQIGKTPTGFVQFFPDSVCSPCTIVYLIRSQFFDRFTGCNDTVLMLLRVHSGEFKSRMRFAGNWQNFVRPSFRVVIDINVRWHPPVSRFTGGHFMNQFPFKRVNLR